MSPPASSARSRHSLPMVLAVLQVASIAAGLTAACLLPVRTAMSHGGGTPRLTSAQAGPYDVYAWSEPEPLRQGEVHLTIGVTIPATNTELTGKVEAAITDANVAVTYTSLNGEREALTVQAQPQETLGTVYYEADAEIPSSGRWRIAIAVEGREGSGATSFTVDVAQRQAAGASALAAGGAILVGALVVLALRARGREAQGGRPSQTRRKVAES